MVADPFTDRAPVLSRNVDNHHIGRRPTPRQFQRFADLVDGEFLTEQSEQLGARAHASVQQSHTLRDCWCRHLNISRLVGDVGLATEWSALLGRRADRTAG
jgi:hypothetical protein